MLVEAEEHRCCCAGGLRAHVHYYWELMKVGQEGECVWLSVLSMLVHTTMSFSSICLPHSESMFRAKGLISCC